MQDFIQSEASTAVSNNLKPKHMAYDDYQPEKYPLITKQIKQQLNNSIFNRNAASQNRQVMKQQVQEVLIGGRQYELPLTQKGEICSLKVKRYPNLVQQYCLKHVMSMPELKQQDTYLIKHQNTAVQVCTCTNYPYDMKSEYSINRLQWLRAKQLYWKLRQNVKEQRKQLKKQIENQKLKIQDYQLNIQKYKSFISSVTAKTHDKKGFSKKINNKQRCKSSKRKCLLNQLSGKILKKQAIQKSLQGINIHQKAQKIKIPNSASQKSINRKDKQKTRVNSSKVKKLTKKSEINQISIGQIKIEVKLSRPSKIKININEFIIS